MGTRSLTKFFKNEKPFCCVYRQFDGYPSGHGQELADFCKKLSIVNGIDSREARKIANGMGCLAAQFIAKFKKEKVGEIYIHHPDDKDVGEDYIYHVYIDVDLIGVIGAEAQVKMDCIDSCGKVLFEGYCKDFNGEKIEKDNMDEEE
jgi:hypothetical protein